MTNDIKNVADILQSEPTAMCYTSGYSMYPMLADHKNIAVIGRLEREPRLHDVLLYKKRGFDKLVLHRLIKIKSDGAFIFRGDNTYKNEYDIKREDIIGILVGFYKNGKYTDCEKSRVYAIYVCLMRAFYPVRFIWKRIARPTLSRIKKFILK